MKKTVPAVGDIIDARCTKCKQVTNHVTVAVVESKPAKVQCNTCGGTHRYRHPDATPRVAKAAGDASPIRHEEWHEFQAAMGNIVAKDYHMDLDFRVGSVVRHPHFGLGLVRRMAGNRKMEILFESGKKLLRCK